MSLTRPEGLVEKLGEIHFHKEQTTESGICHATGPSRYKYLANLGQLKDDPEILRAILLVVAGEAELTGLKLRDGGERAGDRDKAIQAQATLNVFAQELKSLAEKVKQTEIKQYWVDNMDLTDQMVLDLIAQAERTEKLEEWLREYLKNDSDFSYGKILSETFVRCNRRLKEEARQLLSKE